MNPSAKHETRRVIFWNHFYFVTHPHPQKITFFLVSLKIKRRARVCSAYRAMHSLPPEILEKIFLRTQMSCMDLFDLRRVCHNWNSVLSDPLFINKYVLRQRYSPYPALNGSVVHGGQLEEADETVRRIDGNEGIYDVGGTHYSELEIRYFPWGNHPEDPYNISYTCLSVACWIFNEKCSDFNFTIVFEKSRYFLCLCLNADTDEWALKVGHQAFKFEKNPFVDFYTDSFMHFAITYDDHRPYGGTDLCVYINGCEQQLVESYYNHGASNNIWGDKHQCLVDLRLFPFRLSSLEIEAIHQQRCSFDLVLIGKALMEKKDSINEEEWLKPRSKQCHRILWFTTKDDRFPWPEFGQYSTVEKQCYPIFSIENSFSNQCLSR